MLPFYILTHRKVGYFARGCPTIWKSSIVPPWSLQDGGTTCSDGWAINVTTGPCIDKYVQRYNALAINMHYHWKHIFMNGCIGILYSWMCMCIAAHVSVATWWGRHGSSSKRGILQKSFLFLLSLFHATSHKDMRKWLFYDCIESKCQLAKICTFLCPDMLVVRSQFLPLNKIWSRRKSSVRHRYNFFQ